MHCYKCKTTEDLSVKKTNRNGSKLMICRPCRREYANNRVKKSVEKVDWSEDWGKLAKQVNERIMAKYA